MPEGRSGMIAFLTTDSEPAYYGGSSWNETGKRIHASGYALRNGQWQPLDSLPKPIAYAAVASENGLLYAAGGTDGIDLHPTILAMSDRQRPLVEIIPSQARVYAGAAFVDGVFYQIGGSTNLSPLVPSDAVSKFEQGSWNDVGQIPEGPLINPAVCLWKGRILVIGGGRPSPEGLENSDAIFSFDPKEQAWTKRAKFPAPARGAVAVLISDHGVLIVSGYPDPPVFSPQIQLFDPEKNNFVSLASLPIGLMLPAVVTSGKWIYVFGGEDAPKHRSNRVYRTALSRLMESHSE